MKYFRIIEWERITNRTKIRGGQVVVRLNQDENPLADEMYVMTYKAGTRDVHGAQESRLIKLGNGGCWSTNPDSIWGTREGEQAEQFGLVKAYITYED